MVGHDTAIAQAAHWSPASAAPRTARSSAAVAAVSSLHISE